MTPDHLHSLRDAIWQGDPVAAASAATLAALAIRQRRMPPPPVSLPPASLAPTERSG